MTPAKNQQAPQSCMPVSNSLRKKYAQMAVKAGSSVAMRFAVVAGKVSHAQGV